MLTKTINISSTDFRMERLNGQTISNIFSGIGDDTEPV